MYSNSIPFIIKFAVYLFKFVMYLAVIVLLPVLRVPNEYNKNKVGDKFRVKEEFVGSRHLTLALSSVSSRVSGTDRYHPALFKTLV